MTQIADMTMETTQTMGVGAITLLGAVPGFRTFLEAGIDDGGEVFFCQRQKGGAFEVCKGTFHAPSTLTRDAVDSSSIPGNVRVNWGDGIRSVYIVVPASQLLLKENALSEIANFLIAENLFSEIAALGTADKDGALGNLGATVTGRALLKAVNAATARGVLSLGTAALLNVGLAATNVVQLDGAGKLPAVPGDLLTSLPAHSHNVLIGGYTGGASGKVVRYNSSGTVVAADKGDAPTLLTHLLIRGSDGNLYGRGSIRVPFTGAVAGQRYWLGAAGGALTAPPTPISSPLTCQVEIAQSLETDFLYFDPLPPIGGATGFGDEVQLYLDSSVHGVGTLRVR